MITPDTVDKIMDATRVEEVVGEFVTLKKRGVNLLGLCPFHNEKTPSFTVSVAKGIYKCFGCGKGGNAVNFLMEHEHYTYPEALRYLAGKYGIELEETKPSPEQQQAMDEKESLFALTAFAQKYFQEQLHETEEGRSIALTYLKERGFSLDAIHKYGMGYSLNKWDAFCQEALSKGYKKEYLLKTSLAKSKEHQLYDTFRGRIIFPIHNLSGRVLGFGARILTNDKSKPKYVNSAESDIYHKSKVLFGLYFAKSAMAANDYCLLVEGYTDVISLVQAGIENVIASSGTALTLDQIKLIRRYTSNITLLFDNDNAGIKAAFRGIDMILEEGMNVRIVLLPEGEDPDSFARENRPSEVKAFIEEHAKDFISLKTQLLLKETQNDPIRKAALIKEISQTISLIPEPIARTLYIQKCSELMQVEEKLLVAEVNKLRRKKFTQQRAENKQPEEQELVHYPGEEVKKQQELTIINDFQEKEIIRLLLNYSEHEIIFEVDNQGSKEAVVVKVLDFIVQDIVDDQLDFENEDCKTIFELFVKAKHGKHMPGPQFFTNHPQERIRKLAIDLLTTPYTLSKNWEDKHHIFVDLEEDILKTTVIQAVYAFKLRKLETMIELNQQQLKSAHENQDVDDNQMIKLLEANNHLKSIRSKFAKELNRVVTR